ncbi:hypothetical protein ACIO6T_26395 [Streptomyces sp. NPDC087532]|uniref:hypothetical protein n=1 Tax=Streptomyces sp. NPDC087532 TaxID=3365795 RepID=UPI0037F8573F
MKPSPSSTTTRRYLTMSTLDLDGLAPNTEVLVAPVHLAGPGTRAAVFGVLDNAEGWTKTVAFGTDTYYTSPCQRVRIANPVERHYGGWTISYAEDPLGVPDWINMRLAKPTATVPRAQAALVRRPYAAHPPAPGAKASTPSASPASQGRSRCQR